MLNLRALLPNKSVPVRILRGPFRGARLVMNPRNSLRKIFGLYEHELNPWLKAALGLVHRVLDVGANNGYFMFGTAACIRRQNRGAEIIGFEPQKQHILELTEGLKLQPAVPIRFKIVQSLVGKHGARDTVCLDNLSTDDYDKTLVKIDVEGAEMDVLEGARKWLRPGNLFLIEVHEDRFVPAIQDLFDSQSLAIHLVKQEPLPILGRESRDANNCWLVSTIPEHAGRYSRSREH